MTKFSLSCFAATVAASAVALPQNPVPVRNLESQPAQKSVSLLKGKRAVQSKAIDRNANNVNVLTSAASKPRSLKQLNVIAGSKAVNPFLKKAPAAKAAGKVLSEDFEGWDGKDYGWLPNGFSYRHDSNRDGAEGWEITPESAFQGMLRGLTGNALAINYDMDFLDEWIIFPEVTLADDMVLSFDTLNDGVWYFSMENVNWDTLQYEGDKVLAYDQQVMISEDDGETWKVLKSLAEDFSDIDDFEQLLYMADNTISRINVSLADYAGKTVRLAYRYVGTDGNLGVIDNISIGNPALEVSYSNPFGTLFFGMSPESYVLNNSILVGPVYRSMMFDNTTYNYDATYSWNYFGPESSWLTADTQDYLDVTYHTDYTDEFSTLNNLYYTPVLNGYAPGFSEGSYTRGQFLQAGGKGTFLLQDENNKPMAVDFGLTVIDPVSEGSTTVADAGTPIFGYDAGVDRFWSEYTFGNDWDDDNFVTLDAYMDYFFPSENPIVIRGAHASAYGRVKRGAKFKAEIVPLSDEGIPMDPIAVAECGYSDLNIYDTGGTNNFITLNFTFAEPVVMSYDVCMAYVVRISGFNDPSYVEYFSPLLSAQSNPDGYALGWIQKTIVMDGNERESMTPVANYIEDYLSFYIMLDAEFPWLEGPDSVSEWTDGSASVVLDSSVEGKDLVFENMPSWLTASAEGQYGETVVTFSVDETDVVKETTDITVSTPGVSHVITVNPDKATGVAGISADSSAVEIYNLSGVRVASADAPGIYILKDSKGNAKKVVVD